MMEANDNLWMAVYIAVVAALLVFVLWVNCGCDDGCTPEETRCRGQVVEICYDDNNWRKVLSCEQLEPYEGEVCCWDEALDAHSCLLPEECEQ